MGKKGDTRAEEGANGFILDPGQLPTEPREIRQAERIRAGEEEVESLLSTIPLDNTHYLKVYKVRPLPAGYDKPAFLKEIMDLSNIDDLEIHIRDLAREYNWGSGEYQILTFGLDPETGKRLSGFKYKPVRFNIDLSSFERPNTGPVQTNLIDEINRFRAVKDAFNQGTPVLDVNSLSKTMSETLRAGLDFVKTDTKGGDGQDALSTIKTLKELGFIPEKGKEVPRPVSEGFAPIIQLLAILKELGIVGQKQIEQAPKDIWAEIAKMRELGLIPKADQEKEDIVSTASKLKELITLIQPMISPGSESVSFGVELIRTLGPHIPEIVKDITTTVNNAVEISRMRRGEVGRIAPPPPTSEQRRQISQVTQTQPPPTEIPTNPYLKEIYEAIMSRNTNFFPSFKERLLLYSGEQSLQYLLSGAVSIDTYLGAMSPYVGPWIQSDQAKQYMQAFIDWEKKGQSVTAVSTPLDEEEDILRVVGKCSQCGAEYEYGTAADYDEGSSVCTDCNGKILLV